ncbi:glycoside hydrolase family 108 protein [Devosia sp. YIM 151766]|uniref:glycoside hydrolase family 108 protein n=1 Tax=Devosia sp. YIM 151766 TaxID=3017325 RepID=UPI00255CC76E|nr:glycoside hydrolase family 108 protein [Devosia sp. YIM 151766]WIY52470.1 glycoside hydrolase family 108 protein [Devosia sp. YIM 151766]
MAEFSADIQRWIIASEGGYVDHPRDPGGATNMGITHKTLTAWRGRSVTKADVRSLTKAEALEIYRAQYWDTVRGDLLPTGLDYAVFDYAVNSGPARAAKDLQRELGVSADGIIGSITLEAIRRVDDIAGLVSRLCARRWAFVQGLSTFATFGNGWRRRIWGEQMGIQPQSDSGVVDRATKLALGQAPGMILPQPAPGKANPERPSVIDTLVKDPGGLSGLGAGFAALLGAMADQPILQIAAVALIGVLVWRFVLSRKQADPA